MATSKDTLLNALTLTSILVMQLGMCFLVERWYIILLVTLYILILISNVGSWLRNNHAVEIMDLNRRVHAGLRRSRELADVYTEVIDSQERLIQEMKSASIGEKEDVQEEIDIPAIRKIRIDSEVNEIR